MSVRTPGLHGPVPRARPVRRAAHVALVVLAAVVAPPRPLGAAPDATAPREIVVKTADGLELRAAYHPATTKGGAGVVLLPGFRGRRTDWDRVLVPMRDRGIHVLALDPRGHGRSEKPGKTDLSPLVTGRDRKLFAAMHADALAAVRWLVAQGGCDPKRVALVGAGVGGSVALDAAARAPAEVAAVAWLSPSGSTLGLDAVAALGRLPATLPTMWLLHRDDAEAARPVLDARPGARSVVYEDPPPPAAGAERAWAHGTAMLARLPMVGLTVASFVAAATGSKAEDVVLDGLVEATGPNADPWDRAAEVGVGAGDGTMRAFRVGRRVIFGGTAGAGVGGIRFEVQTGKPRGPDDPMIGPPQVVGMDLETMAVAWSWGGMGSMPRFPGELAKTVFGKTYPTLRAVRGASGTTFEGEWFVPSFNDDSSMIRLVVCFTEGPPERPAGPGVESFGHLSVEVPLR